MRGSRCEEKVGSCAALKPLAVFLDEGQIHTYTVLLLSLYRSSSAELVHTNTHSKCNTASSLVELPTEEMIQKWKFLHFFPLKQHVFAVTNVNIISTSYIIHVQCFHTDFYKKKFGIIIVKYKKKKKYNQNIKILKGKTKKQTNKSE